MWCDLHYTNAVTWTERYRRAIDIDSVAGCVDIAAGVQRNRVHGTAPQIGGPEQSTAGGVQHAEEACRRAVTLRGRSALYAQMHAVITDLIVRANLDGIQDGKVGR